jgi:Spy/CpxP family protein refolding chaperone
MKLRSFLLPLFAAGFLAAQPATPPQQQPQHHARATMMERMAKRYNLSADQQSQATTIFHGAREQAKALSPQLKQEHQAVSAAIKTDNEAQIDQILHHDAAMNAQARAIHAKAMAKFYAILTPDQKAKFDQHMDHPFMHGARSAQRQARPSKQSSPSTQS